MNWKPTAPTSKTAGRSPLQTRGNKIGSLDNWMLFNLKDDPTEMHDLAAQHPDKVKEMEAAFDAEAWSNNVYPLDARALERAITLPPPHDRKREHRAGCVSLARKPLAA
ncbi:MAG: hypothetical protein IPJ18_04195 [Betaproteobacteria bacterium]|nr:hypothetical protein [Betaproteobacteria bacterium]